MFKIAIMGCGVVGSGVADILIEKSAELSKRFASDIGLGKILDIRDLPGTPYEPYLTKNAEDIWEDDEIRLVTVTIGGLDFAYQMCRKALISGRHVVTSNKEVVAAYGRELMRLAFIHHVRFMYEASAGGGIPIIRPLNICLASNEIYEIQGILNGTTNYMLTRMHRDGMSFDEVLKEAQAKGYAEANPSADVDGYDAARKIAILSSIAYNSYVDYREVACTGIREILTADHELAERAGYTIKLIAGSKKMPSGIKISVEPTCIPLSNILSAVSSVYNAVLVKGSYTGDSLFYGQGAGKLPTASAVVGDIIEVLGNPKMKTLPPFVDHTVTVDKSDDSSDCYFVRFTTELEGAALSDLKTLIEGIFGSAAKWIGLSAKAFGLGAFMTGSCTQAELTDRGRPLSGAAEIAVENCIKVIE